MTTAATPGPVRPTRVLLVDDSVVVRRVIARVIDADCSLELAGVARDGCEALRKTAELRPDVVVLDLEMPVMDGFAALAALRRTDPHLPIIVFSHMTASGAAATLDALTLGASDFALKPRADGIGLAEEHIRADLLPRILALVSRPSPGTPTGAVRRTSPSRSAGVVVVAVSTGGPNALADVMPHLPAQLSAPVLVVQHMPALFTAALAERLDRIAAVPVTEADHGQQVMAGHVYVAPGGRHLRVERGGSGVLTALNDDPPENSCRPSADVLFRSAATAYGGQVLGVVLTGMGKDGLRGAEAIHEAGGRVIVQSERTCVVPSMPRAVIDSGLADGIVDLAEIGPTIRQMVAPWP